jgi:hypothetical protein
MARLSLSMRMESSRLQLLQRFQKQPIAPTLYYVFDVLWTEGEDITGKLILERRVVLERIIKRCQEFTLAAMYKAKGKRSSILQRQRPGRNRRQAQGQHVSAR